MPAVSALRVGTASATKIYRGPTLIWEVGGGAAWLLSGGIWDDAGVWDDGAVWEDSAGGVTVNIEGTSAIGLGSDGAAAIDRGLSGTAPLVLVTTATATVVHGLSGMAPLVLAITAAARVERRLSSTAPLDLASTAAMQVERRLAGTSGLALGSGADLSIVPTPTVVVESVTATISDTASPTIFDMPAIRPDGDLYVALIGRDNDEAFTDFIGWNLVLQTGNIPSNNTMRMFIAWRIGSSEPASYSFSHVAPGIEYNNVHVLRISGAHATSPIDASDVTGDDSLATAPIAPNVVAGFSGGLTLRFFIVDTDAITESSAGGDVVELFRDGGGSNQTIGAAGYREPGPAVGVGTGTLAQGGFDDNWLGATVIVRAAGT